MDDFVTLLPTEIRGETVTFKEFYFFVQSELKCSNDLKFWMICEQSDKADIQLTDFKRIYEDFFRINAPYQVALREVTVECFKICMELSADPAQLQRLLRLAQKEAHELVKNNFIDLSFIHCLVTNLIHLSNEIADHKMYNLSRKDKNGNESHLKMLLTKVSKKLEEVQTQRCVMQEKAKIERHRQGIDHKLESAQWFDFSQCPKKYSDFN